MEMPTTLKSLIKANDSAQKSSMFKVLTPYVDVKDNQYLTCLWSSLKEHGVEVEKLGLNQLVKQQIIGKSGTVDIIHLHWIQKFCPFAHNRTPRSFFQSLLYLSSFVFLRARGYRFIWTVHNTLSHDSKAAWFEYGFRWVLSRLSSDIITMSHYGKQEFVQMFGHTEQIHIIPHGSYISAYPNHISRSEARQILGIMPDQKVLLHFGQLKPYKGINHLLAAFQQIKQQQAVLFIAGSSSDSLLTEAIQQAAQADSRIYARLKFIPDEDIQLYMNACDWVVLPYEKILNSGSALLALSFSRPVIVPQKGALTELIQDNEQGICYANDDDLAEAIDRALATPFEQWQQLCINAYELAQKFDWHPIGATLYQVYQRRTKSSH